MSAYLTAAELAARWKCDPSTIRKMARSGVLPAMRLGTDWRIAPEAAEAYEARRTAFLEGAEPPNDLPVSTQTNGGGFSLPADYEPVFPALWPGHESQTKEKRPLAATRKR